MKLMKSRFPGTCRACGGSIRRDEWIAFFRKGHAEHAACAKSKGEKDEDGAAGLEPGTLANDRRLARKGLTVTRFSSGAVVTRNSRGRCEDAPCCGCCD